MATKSKSVPDDCMPKCATCSFFSIEPKESIGFCRRYPPKMVVVNDEIEMVIPCAGPADWCGEYRRFTN